MRTILASISLAAAAVQAQPAADLEKEFARLHAQLPGKAFAYLADLILSKADEGTCNFAAKKLDETRIGKLSIGKQQQEVLAGGAALNHLLQTIKEKCTLAGTPSIDLNGGNVAPHIPPAGAEPPNLMVEQMKRRVAMDKAFADAYKKSPAEGFAWLFNSLAPLERAARNFDPSWMLTNENPRVRVTHDLCANAVNKLDRAMNGKLALGASPTEIASNSGLMNNVADALQEKCGMNELPRFRKDGSYYTPNPKGYNPKGA